MLSPHEDHSGLRGDALWTGAVLGAADVRRDVDRSKDHAAISRIPSSGMADVRIEYQYDVDLHRKQCHL